MGDGYLGLSVSWRGHVHIALRAFLVSPRRTVFSRDVRHCGTRLGWVVSEWYASGGVKTVC